MKKTLYLNNLRWMIVVLVVIYHVYYVYNDLGVIGAIPGTRAVAGTFWFCNLVYPWFMALLFVIAGMCSAFALSKQKVKVWLKGRTVRLLVPSTLGLLAFQWITGLLNMHWAGVSLDQTPAFILYPVAALSGTGPLWFIQLLWIYSLILAAMVSFHVHPLELPEWFYSWKGMLLLWSLWIGLWGFSWILNAPVITVYRFGIYFFAYFAGYFIFSSKKVIALLANHVWILFVLMLAAAAAYLSWSVHQSYNYTDPQILQSPLCNLYAWNMSLFLLGFFARYLNFEKSWMKWMAKNSYSLYVCHYLFIMLVCPYLQLNLQLPAWLAAICAVILVICLSIALGSLISRIPVYRTLVLGMPLKKKA